MKAISKNGKLIATITTISILLKCLLLFADSFSTKPVISDFHLREYYLNLPNNPPSNYVDAIQKMEKDVQIIVGFQLLYLLPSIAVSLFSTVTMILASVVAYSDKNLSFRDFLSRIPKLCLRTLVTSFYLLLLTLGYMVVFLAFLISVMILNMDHLLVLKPIAITLGIFALIFLMYLTVAWDMALVISVIDKSYYGLEALGQAGRLVKGRRVHGFALSLLYTVLMVIIIWVSPNPKSVSMMIICGSFAIVLNCLVTMVYFMSYTVLYFQCKKTHDEEIDLDGRNMLEYGKILQQEDVV
jgi:hypothetical protein